MARSSVGFRFYPTDEELMNHYLMNQILGNMEEVEENIGEIDVYKHNPVSLPLLSRTQSGNGIYYFFVPKVYTNSTKRYRKRSSEHAKWKVSGGAISIQNKNGETIGEKQVLTYEEPGAPKPKGMKSDWIIHEYEFIQALNHNLDVDKYVICKVFDKREDTNITYGNNSSEPTLPMITNPNTTGAIAQVEQPGQDINGNNSSEPTQPMVPDHNTVSAISTLSEVEPPIDNSFWDDFTIPMDIDQEDLSLENNNISNVQLQNPHYLSHEDDEFLGGLKHVNRELAEHLFYEQDLTNPDIVINTLPEENNYDMFVNDFTMPQEDHSMCFEFDSNMQLQAPDGSAQSISAMNHEGTRRSSPNTQFSSCKVVTSFEDLFSQ